MKKIKKFLGSTFISTIKLIDTIWGSPLTGLGYLMNYKLKEGDIVIDAGAYFGHFTISAAKKVGKNGKVIAFEADTENYKVLKNSVKKSGLKNIVLLNKALFNKNSTIGLKRGYILSYVAENAKKNIIPCVRLDDELKRLGIKNVDFLKMDIEGAELEMIEGGKKSLKNTKEMAIACYHIRDKKTTGKIMRPIFKKMGFKTKVGYPPHPTLYCSKK